MDRASTTLADVARAADVSLATASKALNGRDRVSEATRARVIDAARNLSFSPNPLARGLTQRKSGTVGLLTSDLDGRFSLPILMGAEDRFGAGQISVFLCDARGDAIRERHHINALLERKVDGLMVVGSTTDTRPSIGRNLGVPVVYVYTPSADDDDLSLTPDNVEAGQLAVEHLISSGRSRIAHITGAVNEQAALDRAHGIKATLGKHGKELVYETTYGDWTARWGRAAAAVVLAHAPDVDAILCDSDQIARGALDVLKEHGKIVPDHVALMGFDNWEILAAESSPGLTSIDMNLEQLGHVAAEYLFTAMADQAGANTGRKLQSSRLVVRGSTTAGA